jgi:hypothetical protein
MSFCLTNWPQYSSLLIHNFELVKYFFLIFKMGQPILVFNSSEPSPSVSTHKLDLLVIDLAINVYKGSQSISLLKVVTYLK